MRGDHGKSVDEKDIVEVFFRMDLGCLPDFCSIAGLLGFGGHREWRVLFWGCFWDGFFPRKIG